MRQCIPEQDFPDNGKQTIERGIEQCYCVDDWQSLKLQGDFSTEIWEGIYVHIDRCVQGDLLEDDQCYTDEQFT